VTTFPTIGPDQEFPNRPDHLDFDLLSALIIDLDAEAEEAGENFDLEAIVSRYIDPKSLAYLALQRSFRALGISTSIEVKKHQDQLMKLASVYHEAFVMGCRFTQTKSGPKNSKRSGDS
jgi:hypothetical protein